MSYHHLTIEERVCIQLFYHKGMGPTEIAKEMKRDKATISREIRRNASRDEGYNAIGAQRKANKRRKGSVRKGKLEAESKLLEKVCEGLSRYWSPEQISHTLPRGVSVSYSTIYRAVTKKILPREKLRRYGKQRKCRSYTECSWRVRHSIRPPNGKSGVLI